MFMLNVCWNRDCKPGVASFRTGSNLPSDIVILCVSLPLILTGIASIEKTESPPNNNTSRIPHNLSFGTLAWEWGTPSACSGPRSLTCQQWTTELTSTTSVLWMAPNSSCESHPPFPNFCDIIKNDTSQSTILCSRSNFFVTLVQVVQNSKDFCFHIDLK